MPKATEETARAWPMISVSSGSSTVVVNLKAAVSHAR